MNNQEVKNEVALADELAGTLQALRAEIGKAIIGQQEVVDQMLIAILCRGHALLVGVPGLAKTLLVSTVSQTMSLSFSRIQFTPDLMPGDILGSEVLEVNQASGEKHFRFIRGPIFANIVLADEINRTPPKTQAALLEAMQERRVTVAGTTMALGNPFFVLATQNPIEQEGTYPLPEAQLDRFMFNLKVDYPSPAEELEIVKATTSDRAVELNSILKVEDLLAYQDLVRKVPVAENVVEYAVQLVGKTRITTPQAPGWVRDLLSWGAGPRASQFLVLGAKAHALMRGKYSPDIEDVEAIALPALRHRIVPSFNAEADGITADEIIRRLLAE
ncbi:MAG: MoxR family ATPase [Bacteroidetes bacterium]|jgi:MoxR-like ATPase|nr:MoxR family ATPase [Bacteroidota bacterium]